MKNKKTGNKNIVDDSPETAPGGQEIKDKDGDAIAVPKSKMILIKRLLQNIKENNDHLVSLLSTFISPEEETRIGVSQLGDKTIKESGSDEEMAATKVVEGVFDGENMIGPDGKQYSVPANYASKSKLVEGDILKLTITANGTFVFKQIGPIERLRLVGSLERSGDNEFIVKIDKKSWQVLSASVTYFKGEVGDEVAILVPKAGESRWAAVENIIKRQ